MKEHRSTAPVLVGVDGSVNSLAAIEFGAWEAKRLRAPLHLVNAYRGQTPHSAGALPRSRREDARAMVIDLELAAHARYPGLAVHSTTVKGGAASSLVELSRDATLVVVGARGRGGFRGLRLGAVATQVVSHAHAPVALIRPPLVGTATGLDHNAADRSDRFSADEAVGAEAIAAARTAPGGGPVIVGVDGSHGSDLAVAAGFDEAAARGTPLILLTAWYADPFDPVRSDDAIFRREADMRAEHILTTAAATWTEKFPEVQVVRRVAPATNPSVALIEASRAASLLVVSTRGRGGFASLLLGSVGRSVAAHAECPVLIVRDRP
jgi:nucleotide-binding universal stress UspA family protein